MNGVLDLLRAAQAALVPYMRVIPGTGEPGIRNEAGQVHDQIRAYLNAPPSPEPVGGQVLVPRELIREAALLAACFASTRHVQASVQKNPAVKAELLAEVARAEKVEGELRATLALPSHDSVAQLARAFWEAERALEAERDRLLNITIDERVLRPETTSRATYMQLLEQRRLAQDALFAALEAQHADPA